MERIIPIPEMEMLVNRDYKTLWNWYKKGRFPALFPLRVGEYFHSTR